MKVDTYPKYILNFSRVNNFTTKYGKYYKRLIKKKNQ